MLNPVILLANNRKFEASESMTNPNVSSRMMLWCKQGLGRVRINGELIDFQTGDFCILPWLHSITYMADDKNPFLLAGIHLIPDIDDHRKTPFYRISHDAKHPHHQVDWIRNMPIDGLEDLVTGNFMLFPGLELCVEYILERFLREKPRLEDMREAAYLLLREWKRVVESHGDRAQNLPEDLQGMIRYVRQNIQHELGVDELSRYLDVSASTLGRLFKKHFNSGVAQWVAAQRVEQAKKLLSGTKMSVKQIGARVGLSDPYYFSKCFKKFTDHSPREYRKVHAVF